MPYLIVTLHLPDLSIDEYEAIFDQLQQNKWTRVREVGSEVTSLWWGSFRRGVPELDAKHMAYREFVQCCRPYCVPRMALHWGEDKPSFYGFEHKLRG